jgi:hypothetical protein
VPSLLLFTPCTEPPDTAPLQDCEPLFVASKNVAYNITQNEKRTPDPSTWGCIPGCNFQTTVVKWFNAAKEESERDSKRQRGEQGAGGGAQKKAAVVKRPPIILLPRSESAVLNMRNGRQFFEQGIFVSEQQDLSQEPPKEFNVTCVLCRASLVPQRCHPHAFFHSLPRCCAGTTAACSP